MSDILVNTVKKQTAISLDPGNSTGMCCLRRCLTVEESKEIGLSERDKGYFTRTIEQEEVWRELTWAPGTVIAFYEEYVGRSSRVVHPMIAAEIIGALKMWAYALDVTLVKVQPAQTHKIRREDVKAAGWTWNTEHEFDAIRILIYGLTMLRYR